MVSGIAGLEFRLLVDPMPLYDGYTLAGRSPHERKIDIRGCLLAILASSTTIIGISLAGDVYPWLSKQACFLLGVSLIFWILFFRAESGAEEPILDPLVLRNRSFSTVRSWMTLLWRHLG